MCRRVAAALGLLVAGLVLSVLVSHGAARAGGESSSTSEVDTATVATSTTTPVTTASPVTTITATTATTTTTSPTTTVSPRKRLAGGRRAPRSATLVARRDRPNARCAEAGVVEIVMPRHRAIVLAEPRRRGGAPVNRFVYPADASLVAAGSLQVAGSCRRVGVDVRSLSLFGGVVTAVEVTLQGQAARRSGGFVKGLRVGGRVVAAGVQRLALDRWGVLRVARGGVSPLVVRLLRAHAGLPAGTIVRVAFFVPNPMRKRAWSRARKAARLGRPLKVRPPLGLRGYVFPVAGSATFLDSYGAFRADVSGNWHHGDDIFANVGTPVVAVANGALNRVGWEPIGGWRLWVRDRRRNGFYYAHLSGYSPQALRSNRVKAGEVLGFVGNTGDAFTTPFHLHFEIHPHQLLGLGYNGAVDPTGYLEHWQHLKAIDVPAPVLPANLPAGDPRREARFVFGELLAARGLRRHAPTAPPRIRLPGHDLAARPFTTALAEPSLRHARRGTSLLVLVLVAAAAVVMLIAAAVVAEQRRKPARDGAEPAASESG
jgi:murein DD-endopeptidase MepM/ murein hydrolase activator NlpD